MEATPYDISENPKTFNSGNWKQPSYPGSYLMLLQPLSIPLCPEAGLNPLNDALIIEGSESPYANVLVVKKENVEKEEIKVLVEVLTSDSVRDFILEEYKGAVVPVF